MDLFENWINKKDESKWIKRALTDKSYKNEYQRENSKEYTGLVNTDLATYGDAVIKLCYLELLLDKTSQLTIEKDKYESDEFFVDVVAKHYDLIKYIRRDTKDAKLSNDYDYNKYQSKNGNTTKYIATCVEAIIGAIYKETKDLNQIIKLLDSWRNL